MEQIALYLAKFTGIVPQERVLREATVEILSRHAGIPITLETVSVRGNTVFIHASPAVKNILFMYKEDVVRELQERVSRASINDVR